MPEEFKQEPVSNLHGEAELFEQFAMIETDDLSLLPDSAMIMVAITDCNGKFGKSLPFYKKDFLAMFFETTGKIYCCRVRAVIHKESNLAELYVLNQKGEETGKIIRTSPGRLHKTFQPVFK